MIYIVLSYGRIYTINSSRLGSVVTFRAHPSLVYSRSHPFPIVTTGLIVTFTYYFQGSAILIYRYSWY